MPYPKNVFGLVDAKIKSIDTQYTNNNTQITTLKCYEYQGKNKRTDKPEGINWQCELWDKTSEYFLEKRPKEGDRVSLTGSIVDKSFEGQDGEMVWRQAVRVNNISLLPVDTEGDNYATPQSTQRAQFRTRSASAPVAPEQSTEPVDFDAVLRQTDDLITRLEWTSEQGRQHLMQAYNKRSRQLLSNEELLDFLGFLQAEVDKIPF